MHNGSFAILFSVHTADLFRLFSVNVSFFILCFLPCGARFSLHNDNRPSWEFPRMSMLWECLQFSKMATNICFPRSVFHSQPQDKKRNVLNLMSTMRFSTRWKHVKQSYPKIPNSSLKRDWFKKSSRASRISGLLDFFTFKKIIRTDNQVWLSPARCVPLKS